MIQKGTADMINKKTVLATIIGLLIIFIPLTIASFFLKEKENPFDKNPGHDFYYKEMLWFYDKDGQLINNYHCNTTSCGYAEYIIDDEDINYYKEGTVLKSTLNSNYVFLKDGALTYLYSLKLSKVLQSYKSIKTYNTHLFDNTYILQNQNELWGVLSVGESINSILPFEYNFIGLINKMNDDGTLNTDTFIVNKDNKWSLISKENKKLSADFNAKIVDFNKDIIVTKNNEQYHIYNYTMNEYLTNYLITNCKIVKNYIMVESNNMLYVYRDLNNSYIRSYNLNNGSLDILEDNNKIVLKLSGNILDTLEV